MQFCYPLDWELNLDVLYTGRTGKIHCSEFESDYVPENLEYPMKLEPDCLGAGTGSGSDHNPGERVCHKCLLLDDINAKLSDESEKKRHGRRRNKHNSRFHCASVEIPITEGAV